MVYNFFDIRNTQAGINKNCTFLTTEQIAVCLLQVLIFADYKCLRINFLNGKLIAHIGYSFPQVQILKVHYSTHYKKNKDFLSLAFCRQMAICISSSPMIFSVV